MVETPYYNFTGRRIAPILPVFLTHMLLYNN